MNDDDTLEELSLDRDEGKDDEDDGDEDDEEDDDPFPTKYRPNYGFTGRSDDD